MTISIEEDAAKALVRLARAQRREPRAQAAVLLTQAIADRSTPGRDHGGRETEDAEPDAQHSKGHR